MKVPGAAVHAAFMAALASGYATMVSATELLSASRSGGRQMSLGRRNGDVSFWYASTAIPPRRPPLPRDREADICIVGAGFTGLWTAYYLKRVRPELEVVVLEREFAGFEASGRNGGWLSDRFAAPRADEARAHGREGRARPPARDAGDSRRGDRCLRAGGIDADIVKNGLLFVARGPAQTERLRCARGRGPRLGPRRDGARSPGARRGACGCRGRARARGPRTARASSPRSSCRDWPRPWSGSACRSTRARPCARWSPGARAKRPRHGPRRHRAHLPRGLHGVAARRAAHVAAAELRDRGHRPVPAPVWDAIGWDGGGDARRERGGSTSMRNTSHGGSALGGRGGPTSRVAPPTGAAQTQPRDDASSWWVSCTSCSRPLRRCRSRTPGAACWACPRRVPDRAARPRAPASAAAGGYVGPRRGHRRTWPAARCGDLVLGEADGAHCAAVGGAQRPALGARAAALAGIATGLWALPGGGPARGPAGDVGEQRAGARRRSHRRTLTRRRVTLRCMCETPHPPQLRAAASETEIQEAALQYVRKISGSTKPSRPTPRPSNARSTRSSSSRARLLDGLVTTAPPKDREVEAAKRRARAAERFAA